MDTAPSLAPWPRVPACAGTTPWREGLGEGTRGANLLRTTVIPSPGGLRPPTSPQRGEVQNRDRSNAIAVPFVVTTRGSGTTELDARTDSALSETAVRDQRGSSHEEVQRHFDQF